MIFKNHTVNHQPTTVEILTHVLLVVLTVSMMATAYQTYQTYHLVSSNLRSVEDAEMISETNCNAVLSRFVAVGQAPDSIQAADGLQYKTNGFIYTFIEQ